MGGSQSKSNGVFKRRGRDTREACTRREGHVRTHEKVVIYKPKREASGETNLVASRRERK